MKALPLIVQLLYYVHTALGTS
uniref:Uncharacterized protein n=1 Tax=Arundo donax TaxID=35708 RepID=A0A0A9FM42_ARUDO